MAHLFTATCSLGQLLLELLAQTPFSSFVPAPILLLPSHSSPPLNHTLDCPQVLQQHSDNPINHSCPTKLFYTASTAGFCRYIVCIPIYPYSLISILFFLNFCTHTPSTFCRYHTLESLSSLLPFYSVFLSIDFLVFLLSFHRFSTLHTICTSAASAATQLAAPAVMRAPFR